MTQVNTLKTQGYGVGNIVNNPSDIVEYRGRKWFFTWNNYSEENITQLTQYIDTFCTKYMFQEEVGKEGTRHLQGFFIMKNAVKNTTLFKKFVGVYIRKLKSEEQAKLYCSKEETRNGRQWSKGYIEIEDPLSVITAWQQKILDLISKKPDARTVTWVIDKIGNTGKTALAKHICLNDKNAIYVGGKEADTKHAIIENINAGKPPSVVIFDFPRSCKDYISYQALE